MSHSPKTIKALEGLLAALKEECGVDNPVAAARPRGNRTAPTTSYRGGNVEQDLMDVARLAVRLSRAGKTLSKKERKIARNVMKAFKASHRVLNTNGVDVFTHNGA